jgi:hypothetical protein
VQRACRRVLLLYGTNREIDLRAKKSPDQFWAPINYSNVYIDAVSGPRAPPRILASIYGRTTSCAWCAGIKFARQHHGQQAMGGHRRLP